MTYREILVHVKAYEGWSPHLEVALNVARQFGARLTALYTIRELAMIKLVLGANSAAAREAEMRDTPLATEAERNFRNAAHNAGVSVDWQIGEGNASELLSLAGRYYDLVIIEQASSRELGFDAPDECTVHCGTPVLIIPKTQPAAVVGKRILIAWNGSRQSAAALRGGLEFIQQAEQVTLLLGRDRDVFPSVTRRPRFDLGANLRRQNTRIVVVPFDATDDAGAQLLSACREADADLLVMGAYGRAAWREFIFGSATQTVLRNMHLPVLMAH